MNWLKQKALLCLGALMVAALGGGCASTGPSSNATTQASVVLVVMDPLAKELACACVKGYGQRDYRKLAARIAGALKQPVGIEFSDDLAETLRWVGTGKQVIVAGERSVVVRGAQQAGINCHPVCELTDMDGNTSFSGVFVARSTDTVKNLKEIAGRKILFGLPDTAENHALATASLRSAGIESSAALEKKPSHSAAALDVLDNAASPGPIAVIPGYAIRLLEGCGSVKPGELKVIGSTTPAPFITVFLADGIPVNEQQKICRTLLGIGGDSALLKIMESRDGFKPVASKETGAPQANAWPDFRGAGRNGLVPGLPAHLPEKPQFVWKKPAMAGCLAGLSVSDGRLILAERDFGDENDVYRCLNAANGEVIWRAEFPARGKLDYGQSPRATPVIHKGKAYLLGAFGDLRCVNVTNGKPIWERQLPREFQADLPTWGMCSTPLIVDELLIVNPGGTNASLAALECGTGKTRWITPGRPAAYASFVSAELGGQRQIVGYDRTSLGGWEVKTGQRLWQLVPSTEGDFNVPTPLALNGGLLVATENNGTRFYKFDASGRILDAPAVESVAFKPETTTPVAAGGRLFGASRGLVCLDLQNELKCVWQHADDRVGDHASLIADEDRVLVITQGGELILLDAKANECAILSRLRVFDSGVEIYSHPALVGTRLYLRGGFNVVCLELGTG